MKVSTNETEVRYRHNRFWLGVLQVAKVSTNTPKKQHGESLLVLVEKLLTGLCVSTLRKCRESQYRLG